MTPYEEPIKDPKIPKSYDQEATDWLAWWLNNRRKQLRQNTENMYGQRDLYGPEQYIRNNLMTSSLRNTNLGGLFKGISRDRLFTNRVYYAQLNNTANAPQVIEHPEYNTKSGEYVIRDKKGKGHYIKYPGTPDMPTRIHERTHAMKASPQENTIRKQLLYYHNNKYPSSYTNYLLDPSETYSRMNEFRYNTKIQPTQKVDKKFLDEHRKELKDSRLDVYTDESLIWLFNEIAQNNTQTDNQSIYAKKGIKLISKRK